MVARSPRSRDPASIFVTVRLFKQRDLTDCGAACFAFVCDHYGLRLPLAALRRELGTDRQGTSAASLVQSARRLGFTAKA